MLTFHYPWLALLLLLPIIVRLLLTNNKKIIYNSTSELFFPYIEKLAKAFASVKPNTPRSNYWFIILLSLIWTSLVFSVMHPIWLDKSNYVNKKGYDIMLAVDISESMNALDFSTPNKTASRLDVTKEVVNNFIRQRHGDRLGLILFGEHAYLQVPMTFDAFALGQMLNNAIAGMAGLSTAIGDAIGMAIRELRNRSEGSRILILLTDGTDTASNIPPLEAAKIAQQYNIRVYTIGIGKDGPVPYRNVLGQVSLVEIGMDEELLKTIASTTGGQYFRAADDHSLEKIYSKINELEKVELTITEYHPTSLYRYPLSIACALIIILYLLPLYNRSVYGT